MVDSSDPGLAARGVASLELEGRATSMDVGSGTAYVPTRPRVGSWSVQVVSLRDPLHPWLIGEHRSPGEALDVALSGNTLLVAEGYGGLLLLDATECAFPPPRHPAGRLVPSP